MGKVLALRNAGFVLMAGGLPDFFERRFFMFAEKLKKGKIKNGITAVKHKLPVLLFKNMSSVLPPFVLKSKKKNIIRGVCDFYMGRGCICSYKLRIKQEKFRVGFIGIVAPYRICI